MRLLGRILALLRPYPIRAFLSVALGVLMVGVATRIPLVLGTVVDDLVAHRAQAAAEAVAVLAALVAARFAAGAGRRAIGGWIGTDIQRDLRDRLARRLLTLDQAWHDGARTGQLLSRATSDVTAIQYFLSFASVFTVLNTLTAVIATVQLWLLSPRLALVALAFTPALVVLAQRYNRRAHRTFQQIQQRVGELTSVVEETAAGIEVVKAFGREDQRRAVFTGEAGRLLDDNLAAARLSARYGPLVAALPQLSLVAVLWYGGSLVTAGDITLGTLIAVISYLTLLGRPLESVGLLLGMTQRAVAAAERVFEIVDAPDGIRDRPGAADLPAPTGSGPVVTVEHVGFAYAGGRPVLTGVDLHLAAGQCTALTGDTGAGKSTLAALLTRTYDPTSGRILLDGHDLTTLTLASIRAAVIVVHAEPVLFSGTLHDNLTFGAPDASPADIKAALWTAAALDVTDALPDGLDTLVGERGLTLSGGQRQRIALARALLCRPRVIVFDDALSHLDAVTEATVHDRLPAALGDTAVLIVGGHVTRADHVVRMEDGRITGGIHAH